MPPAALSIEELRNKLPVVDTVDQAFKLTFRHLIALLKLSWLWLLVVIIPIYVVVGWYMYDLYKKIWDATLSGDPETMAAIDTGLTSQVTLVSLLANLITVLPMSSIAVGWHRYLLRREQPTATAAFRFDGVVRQYALLAFLLTMVMTGPGLVRLGLERVMDMTTTAGLVTNVALIGIPLVLTLLILRLGVMFPGIAVQNPDATVAGVWARTRGNTLRLLLSEVAVFLPFVLVSTPLTFIMMAFRDNPSAVIGMQVAMQLVTFLGAMAVVTILSLAYRHFYERDNPAPATVGG